MPGSGSVSGMIIHEDRMNPLVFEARETPILRRSVSLSPARLVGHRMTRGQQEVSLARTSRPTLFSPTRAAGVAIIAFASPLQGGVGVPPDYGFAWATIGAVGNRPYEGRIANTDNRGSVGYAYRMAKTEITTADWLEFVNIFAPQSKDPAVFGRAGFWGAERDGAAGPGRYRLNPRYPDAGRLPVWGLNWESAAHYCNWLHNGKRTTWDAITSGAYDESAFFGSPNWNPAAVRTPGARFWIPSLDEWVKAVHFDPNAVDPKFPGQGRWWMYPNGTDTPLIPGAPGVGQTSAGWSQVISAILTPVGAYTDVLTPWGLLDASGGATELNEEYLAPFYRGNDGAQAGDPLYLLRLDTVWESSASPSGYGGLRLASSVPGPSTITMSVLVGFIHLRRRRSR